MAQALLSQTGMEEKVVQGANLCPDALPTPTERPLRWAELIAEFKTATLVIREGKQLRTRSMTVLSVDRADGAMWFVAAGSERAIVTGEADVQVTCQSPTVHVTVCGAARAVCAAQAERDLAARATKALRFGAAVSDLEFIHFSPSRAEYSDASTVSRQRASVWCAPHGIAVA